MWRARIFVAADATITNYAKVIQIVKEFYNTFFADEQCELVIIGSFMDPLVVERLKSDPTYMVSVVDVQGRRYADPSQAYASGGQRAINESLDLGIIIHEGGLTEMLEAMTRQLAKADVMTVVTGV